MANAPSEKDDRPAPELALRRNWSLLADVVGPFLALAAVITLFGAIDYRFSDKPTFLTARNAQAISVQTATVAVAALGMTLIIIAGGIDLSAGTALALSATVLAYCLKSDVPAPLAVLLALVTGGACGCFNGILISALRVVPFIATLGTMTVYLGIAKYIADETTVRPNKATQVPEWLSGFLSIQAKSLWAGLPLGVWLALCLALTLAVLLRYTVFSRYVFAIGSNEATARLCGINVPLTKIAVYTLAGFFVGVAGVYQFSRLSVGSPTSGSGMELRIIAAVVIGGGSLSGGRGTVLGTLTGAAIMSVIDSGCTQLGIRNPAQDVILGVIIIAAVTIDQLRQRRTGA